MPKALRASTSRRRCTVACLPALCALLGCSSSVEVTRTFSAQDAANAQREKLAPVAVVRGSDRIPLPPGSRVEGDHVAVARQGPRSSEFVHKLAPGDVIVQDEKNRIVAVRSAGHPPVVTRFVPGTASSPADSDDVRGVLATEGAAADGGAAANTIALQPNDGIEMHGTLSTDDPVPGGGRVEASRSTGMLVAGLVVLGVSYLPSAYVGLESSREGDRILLLPVLGPWIDLAQRPTCVSPPIPQLPPPYQAAASSVDVCTLETVNRIALVVGGGVQALGTLFTVIGLPSHAELVGGADKGVSARTGLHVSLVPAPGGLAAVGTF